MIEDVRDGKDFRKGHVLVTKRTDPDWEPVMRRAAAIVTEQGGRTCHAAMYAILYTFFVSFSPFSIAREMGIPAIVGTGNACSTIEDGQEVLNVHI